MPEVLTKASTILCGLAAPASHGGKVVVAPNPAVKLFVGVGPSAAPVVTKADIATSAIDPISKCQTPTSPTTAPCLAVTGVTAGEATKLSVANNPVPLSGVVVGATGGNPPGTLFTKAEHQKLFSG